MLKMSDESKKPPTVIERYFRCRYKADVQKSLGGDQLILTHSNRISVICIADSHPILREGKVVSSIDFDVAGGNRLAIRVSGKGKKGAQSVKPESVLCKVTCSDESVYLLKCCVKGQLIEVNENLCRSPQLLTEKPKGTGYIAIILPYLKSFDEDMKRLKSVEEYHSVLRERSEGIHTTKESAVSS